jgi:hypothetical protein
MKTDEQTADRLRERTRAGWPPLGASRARQIAVWPRGGRIWG